jgi:hypothetical protein
MKFSRTFAEQTGERGWKNVYRSCAHPACSSTVLARSLRARTGVKVDERWYCTVDCFAVAARAQLSALAAKNMLEMSHAPRLSLGLVLLSKGNLTAGQLKVATAESKSYGEPLEMTLLRLGFVSEKLLVAARATQWGYPVLAQESAAHVESDIPPTLLRQHSATPMHYSPAARRLLIGFVYRVDHSLLHALESLKNLRTEPCFITPMEFKEQMRRLTQASGYEEIVFEDGQIPAQMAKNVGGFASEIAATEARFTRCRDLIWTRLIGRKGMIDLLFRVGTSTPSVAAHPFAVA